MKAHYLILVSALTLTACGSDAESVSPSSTNRTEPQPIEETKAAPEVADAVTQQQADISLSAGSEQEQAEITQTAEQKFELPLGRLTGIIDTGTYKQAILDNQGKVIRLKEGDDWQGWTVTSIYPEKIVINHEGEEHSLLLLSEFRSPQLTETELENQQADTQNNEAQESTTKATGQVFTEEQLTELRSRLLVGR